MAKLKGTIDIVTREADKKITGLINKIKFLDEKIKVVQKDNDITPKVKEGRIKALNKQIETAKINMQAMQKVKIDFALGANIQKAQSTIARIKFNIDAIKTAKKIDPRFDDRGLKSLNKQLTIANIKLDKLQGKKITFPKVGKFSGAISGLKSKASGLLETIGGLPTVLLATVGALASFTIGAGNASKEVTKLRAGIDNTIKEQNILKDGSLTTSEQMVAGLQRVSKGMLKTHEAQVFFNKALQLGLVESQEQFEKLTQNALILGQKMGLNMVQSLELLSEGVAKGSIEILDNAGIVFTAAEAYDAYAVQLGKTASELTDVEKKEARRQMAINQINEQAQILGSETALIVDESVKLAAEWERFQVAIGAAVDGPMSNATSVVTELVSQLTEGAEAWGFIAENIGTVATSAAGTDLGFSNVAPEVQKTVLQADLTSLDEAIAKEKEYLSIAESMGATQLSIVDATQRLADLEAERLSTQEKLSTLTTVPEVSANVNEGIAQALELQKKQRAEAEALAGATTERLNLLKQLQALEKQGLLSSESYVDQLFNKEQSLADLKMFTERAIQDAKKQGFVNELNALDTVAAKTQQIAQLEAQAQTKRIDATAQFEKRRNSFYANEAKRINDLRESGLKGLVGGDLGGLFSELGSAVDLGGDNFARELSQDAFRITSIIAGDIDGEAANLLKDSNRAVYDAIFAGGAGPEIAKQRGQEILRNLAADFDEFGLVDTDAAADRVINAVLGKQGGGLTDAIIQKVKDRNILTPEQLDEALGITKREFGEELDISLVGDEEARRVKELKQEIDLLGSEGSKAINKIAEATDALEKPQNEEIIRLEEIKANWEAIAKAAGFYFGLTGGGGAGGGVPSSGGEAPQGEAPPSPDTSFTTPPDPVPTSNFRRSAPTQNAPPTPTQTTQRQAGGGGGGGPLVVNVMMPNGEVLTQAVLPSLARYINGV